MHVLLATGIALETFHEGHILLQVVERQALLDEPIVGEEQLRVDIRVGFVLVPQTEDYIEVL